MTYVFKFRRGLLWHSITVQGHRHDAERDRMILYFPDGGVREIAHWSDCDAKLGIDWKAAVQKTMEEKSGQAIPVK